MKWYVTARWFGQKQRKVTKGISHAEGIKCEKCKKYESAKKYEKYEKYEFESHNL